MTTSQQPAPSRCDESQDQFWRGPLLHLAACLAIGALVALAVLAIHLLT